MASFYTPRTKPRSTAYRRQIGAEDPMDHPHLRTRRSAVCLLVGVVGLLLVAACSSPKHTAAPNQPFNPLSSTTTTIDLHALRLPDGFQLPDTRFVSLQPVTGKAQPSVPIPVRGGEATVEGTVTGPAGPVGGATVRIERWVGSASGALVVSTDGGGHFAAGGLLGGHYKVRAWQQPSLATFDAATGFVPYNGRLQVDVVMQQHDAYQVQLAPTAATATVGTGFGIVALVSREQVDTNGVVVDAAVNGESVKLAVDSAVKIDGANPAKTGANGFANWTLTCQTAGNFSATATTPDGKATARLPGCTGQGGSTTTTTQPTVIDLPVGGSFTTPDAGPYPAGTYSASSSHCRTAFQVWTDGHWQDDHSSGDTLRLKGPGQDFQPDQGSPDCTYTRIK
jgi:hypothetical protein